MMGNLTVEAPENPLLQAAHVRTAEVVEIDPGPHAVTTATAPARGSGTASADTAETTMMTDEARTAARAGATATRAQTEPMAATRTGSARGGDLEAARPPGTDTVRAEGMGMIEGTEIAGVTDMARMIAGAATTIAGGLTDGETAANALETPLEEMDAAALRMAA